MPQAGARWQMRTTGTSPLALCPGHGDSVAFRFALPEDPYLGCPANMRDDPVDAGRFPIDPRTCDYYQPDCANVGGDGDPYVWFRFKQTDLFQLRWDHQYLPDSWMLPHPTFGPNYQEVLAVNAGLAGIIHGHLFESQANPIGATDYPPNYPGEWDVENGWANYPTRIAIHYLPLSNQEIQALGYDPSVSQPTFQYNVYNMRYDLIGGSGGSIASGKPVELTFPTTDHGGGDLKVWDLGAIAFDVEFIRAITAIQMEIPSVGQQGVGKIVVISESNYNYTIRVGGGGGGLNGRHVQESRAVLSVHLNITPTEVD